jgi:hypothetical protein
MRARRALAHAAGAALLGLLLGALPSGCGTGHGLKLDRGSLGELPAGQRQSLMTVAHQLGRARESAARAAAALGQARQSGRPELARYWTHELVARQALVDLWELRLAELEARTAVWNSVGVTVNEEALDAAVAEAIADWQRARRQALVARAALTGRL